MYNPEQTEILRQLLTNSIKNLEKSSPEKNTTIQAIKEIILAGADPATHDKGQFMNTALLWAILYDENELAFFLINNDKNGSSLNKTSLFTSDGLSENTPLILSIKKGNYDVAQRLLERPEVDPNLSTAEKISPLHLAILSLGCADTQYTVKPQDLLHTLVPEKVALQKEYQLIQALIRQGASLDAKDMFSKTPREYLMHEFHNEELFLCKMGFEDYYKKYHNLADNADLSTTDCAALKIMLRNFSAERNNMEDIIDDFDQAEVAINQLKDKLPPFLQSFLNRNVHTVRELIEAPQSPYKTQKDIEGSGKFIITALAKGGKGTITQLIADYFHFHRHTAFKEIIEKRNVYLKSDMHHTFYKEISSSLEYQQPSENNPKV